MSKPVWTLTGWQGVPFNTIDVLYLYGVIFTVFAMSLPHAK